MATTAVKARADDAKRYWLEEGRGEKGGFIREVDYASQSGGLHPSLDGPSLAQTRTRFIHVAMQVPALQRQRVLDPHPVHMDQRRGLARGYLDGPIVRPVDGDGG